jgi:hypothetical protein
MRVTDPVVDLPALLSDIVPSMPVQSQKYFEAEPEKALEHPLGTGPGKFVSSTPGVEIVLEAVPDHWRQTPAFDRLVIKEIPDDAARLAQVLPGPRDRRHGLGVLQPVPARARAGTAQRLDAGRPQHPGLRPDHHRGLPAAHRRARPGRPLRPDQGHARRADGEPAALPLFTIDQLWAAGHDVGDWTPLNGTNRLNNLETLTPAS